MGLARLQLPAPPDTWRDACLGAAGAGAVTPAGWTPWPHDSFLGAEEEFKHWLPKDVQALYVPGAFTDGLAEITLNAPKKLDLVDKRRPLEKLTDDELLERARENAALLAAENSE